MYKIYAVFIGSLQMVSDTWLNLDGSENLNITCKIQQVSSVHCFLGLIKSGEQYRTLQRSILY